MLRKRLLLFFLLLMNFLVAEENSDFLTSLGSKEYVLDQRQNFFLTSTDYRIAPKVNPITGEYCEEELDLVVAGSQPLSVRRFYNSSSPYDPRYATWRYNPESFFVANLEWKNQELFAAIGDLDGTVCSLKPSATLSYTFDFQIPKNFAISSADGTSHPLNTKINYWRKGDPNDKQRFQYIGTITDGSGRERAFVSPMHRWTSSVHWTEKKGNWLSGSEKKWRILANTWTPYLIPIVEEKLPNGNILCYTFTEWKEENQNFPLPQLLSSITAYNADKTQVLGYIHFHYPRVKYNEVGGIQVTGSDGRSSFMQHQQTAKAPIKLASAHRVGQPLVSYASHYTTLNTVAKPEGRTLTTEYNSEGKVTVQKAPVGPNGEMCPIGRYEYQDKLTIAYDAENNKIHYCYDDNKKLTSIETFQGNTLYRIDRFTWDSSTGNLTRKTIEDSSNNPIHITEYQYDKNQNPIQEKLGDGKEWRAIERTYSDDGFNLKLTETDRKGKLICYAYVPNSNLVASELIYENNSLRKRTFHFYDNCAICIKTIIDDGITVDPDNIQGVTYRKITYITPKKTLPCFGLPEIVEEKTIDPSGQEILLHKTLITYTPFGKILQEEHFDSNNTGHHTLYNTYDNQERLISTTDPLGNKTEFSYDANHNLISITGPKPNQYKEITYDKANRPIRIVDSQADGTLLFLEKKYDKLGRLIQEIDACKNSTLFHHDALGRVVAINHPDGAIEKKEYSILGQLIKETDPLGYITEKNYNAYGQVTTIHHPDDAEEYFIYNPTGTLSSQTDKNNCTICHTYDIFDHLIESTYIFDNKTLKKIQANYTPFCKLSETDGEGNTTRYRYDFSGKKTSESTDTKKTHFTYDPSGLLEQTDCEYFQQIEHHDKAGNLISKTLLAETIQFQEKYAYDETSTVIRRTTSHGTFETLYNSIGKPFLETNPLGHQTQHSYLFADHYHEITTDANNIQTTRIHDNRGREALCIKSNPHGEILAKNESHYDPNGNLITLTQYVFNGPDHINTITHRWEYGPLGRLERFIEAGEKLTQYLYDQKGRLKTLIKPSGIQFNHEYDPLGRLIRYFSSDFDYHYTYDRNDRLLSVYDSLSKSTTTRTYNALGCIKKEILATGFTFSNTFDNQGRRIKLTLPDACEINYTYHGAFLHSVIHNGNTFTYKKRDLEGCPLELELPAKTGTITITRDSLSRISTFTSPVYISRFSQDAFDPVGNLLQYHYEDPSGTVKCRYTYDQLNQLISEEGHTYLFDSLHNRLEKDNALHTINDLCQVLHDGSTEYEYDLDGNLIFDGQWHYSYDTQDHLIALENGKQRIEYTYDPFHRRLSKTVFTNNKRTKYERYLWDGDNEIGAVDESGKITQLRVLGEGLGAEIGAAILYELNDKSYVPIHDHNGNLAVLIDIKTQTPIETCRYTAFGEELTSATLSPWRFSSKRIEEERGLIFFGRRYYLPTLGRWITQDPQGFDDGPNLYAYLSNCPLIRIDPYGLAEFMPAKFDYRRPCFVDYERSFWNKCCAYDLSILRKPELSNGCIFFANGMLNKLGEASRSLSYISDCSGGYNIHGLYNPTHGPYFDLKEAAWGLEGVRTNPVQLFKDEWAQKLANLPPDQFALHICHSHSAIYTNLALQDSSDEIRKRVRVIAFAPADYISRDICHSVQHYEAPLWRDLIPQINWRGRRQNRDSTTVLPSHPNASWHDHSILSPTFEQTLKREIDTYLKMIGEK